MAIWNLVDALSPPVSQPGVRRRFYLPLASIPPGRDAVRAVSGGLYDIDQQVSFAPGANAATTDIALEVGITPPAGGFSDEDGLPDPAIRLHALDRGRLRFVPASGSQQASLHLELTALSLLSTQSTDVRWLQRWVDAGCVPELFIYENVSVTALQALLNNIPALADNATNAATPSYFGVSFPGTVTESTKADYIQHFLNGTDGYWLTVRPGAYIATAGLYPGNPPSPNQTHMIRFHARYSGHTQADPQPMNPRELFHLLFGNDSPEATGHPLLTRLQALGQAQTTTPQTKRFLLRPPLRSWKRVEWESQLEFGDQPGDWGPNGTLGQGRHLFNTLTRGGRTFNNGGYQGFNKCNLFTTDIPLRSGFRACIHPVGNAAWHYVDANSHANLAHDAAQTADARIALHGTQESRAVVWGWKIENWLRSVPAAQRQAALNDAMHEEGRCLILAGTRARIFKRRTLPGGVQGVADCAGYLGDNNLRSLRRGIGHIVIVRGVEAQPQLAAAVHEGVRSIRMRTMQASGAGVRIDEAANALTFSLGGAAANAAAANGYIRLHLFELHPGKDPDTRQGLADLNVRNVNRFELRTADERAAAVPVTHRVDGTPRPAGCQCEDQHPNGAGVMTGNCPP